MRTNGENAVHLRTMVPSARRVTWIVHNALVAPILIVRVPLWLATVVGEWADAILDRLPGLRRYNGWTGFYGEKTRG